MRLLDHVKEIGPAIWLTLIYAANTGEPEEGIWGPVLGLRPVHDYEIADKLRIPVSTAIRWRKRLEKAGVIQTAVCRGGGLAIWFRCSGMGEPPPLESWPSMPTEVVQ
jgi:hypothetical protein